MIYELCCLILLDYFCTDEEEDEDFSYPYFIESEDE